MIKNDVKFKLTKIFKTKTLGEFNMAVQALRSSCRDRKSTRLNSSHIPLSRMPSSAGKKKKKKNKIQKKK